MTTIESPVVREIVDKLLTKFGENRVAYGGSVPNLSTELAHSYHRSWQDSPHDGGYSVHYPGDRVPVIRPGRRQYACAFDITYHDPADIKTATTNLRNWAFHSRANWTGPYRSPIIREIAGTIDGTNVYALDLTHYRSPKQTYGWDSSHLWHNHVSLNRWRILDRNIVPVVLSAFGAL